jgi:diguanylate cyclase (GGDEF)-like protein
MGSFIRRDHTQILMNIIRLIGIFSIGLAIKVLFEMNQQVDAVQLLIVAILFFVFSPWMVSLPSGANWRPGMAFILFSILYFDYRLAILVAIPGALYSSVRKKKFLGNFLLTIGGLSIGIYSAGYVYLQLQKLQPQTFTFLFAILICLLLHFCVNHFIAALIVAHQKQRSIRKQIYSIKNDLNWGYTCTYTVGFMMFLMFREYHNPGLFLATFLLMTIHKSFTYFHKLKIMEKKVYLDGLTNAENRMAWEEFSKSKNKAFHSGSVYMLDLDHFKLINDTYGHEYGDQILQELVCFIKNEIKRKFRLFRYGGDEFILFVFSNREECLKVSEEISDIIIKQNNLWKKRGLNVAISFGNAFYSEEDSLVNAVRNADKLMYRQKFEKNNKKRSLV